MAFTQFDLYDGHIPYEYLDASALALEIGTALTVEDGKLALATGTTKPTYISQYKGMTTNGQRIPVTRVNNEQKYETTLAPAIRDEGELATTIEVGKKYTINDSGTQITDTETGGVAEVVAFEGTTAGSKVLVRFP